MTNKNIKNLVIGIIAEIILLSYAVHIYNFLMTSDGLSGEALFGNCVLLVALSVLSVLNYLHLTDIDIN